MIDYFIPLAVFVAVAAIELARVEYTLRWRK